MTTIIEPTEPTSKNISPSYAPHQGGESFELVQQLMSERDYYKEQYFRQVLRQYVNSHYLIMYHDPFVTGRRFAVDRAHFDSWLRRKTPLEVHDDDNDIWDFYVHSGEFE